MDPFLKFKIKDLVRKNWKLEKVVLEDFTKNLLVKV